jgi:antitoxin ChpS
MLQTLRRAGGSLVMTVPKVFIEQNQLKEGSQVQLLLEGACMTVNAPGRRRYKLKDLLAEMSGPLPSVKGVDAARPVGKEAF